MDSKDQRMMFSVDEKFARDYPVQARELQMHRANMLRLLSKVNELSRATGGGVGEAKLWFPKTEGIANPPAEPEWLRWKRELDNDET